LLGELDRTGNFREASRKLRKLNEIYNKDAEIAGIRTQRANWLAADEEMRKRIDGKTYTQDDYEKWAFKRLNEYKEKGGYGYDRSTGRHNTINTDLRGANLESEVMELAYKAAHDTPLQIEEFFRQNGYTVDPNNPELKTLQETLYKHRDKNQVANEVANFLRKSDRYKTWLEEKADYDWHYDSRNSGDIEGFANKEIEATFQNLNKAKEYYQGIINNPNASKEAKAQAQAGLENATNDITEFGDAYTDAQINGTIPQLGEMTYKHNKANGYLGQLSDAASDLFDVQQITQTLHTREDEGIKGAKDKLDKVDGMVVNVAAGTASGEKGQDVWMGSGTGAAQPTSDTKIFGKGQQELSADMRWAHKEGAEIDAMNALTTRMKQDWGLAEGDETGFEAVYSNAQDYHTLWAREDKWNDRINSMATEITELTKNLGQGTELERKEKRNKIKDLNENILEAKMSKQAEFHYLDQLFTEAGAEKDEKGNLVHPWIQEAQAKGGRRAVYEAAYNRNVNTLNEAADRLTQSSPNLEKKIEYVLNEDTGEFDQVETWVPVIDPNAPKDFDLNKIPSYNIMLPHTQEAIDALKAGGEGSVEAEILRKFRENTSGKIKAMPVEVILNDHAHAFLGGGDKANSDLAGLIDHLESQAPGTSGAGVVVKFNKSTGTVKELTDEEYASHLHYNLEDYYNEPTYVGTAQEGTVQGRSNAHVLRYNRPTFKDKNQENAWIRKQIAATDADRDPEDIQTSEIESFKRDNPAELYVAMDNTSFDVEGQAMKTFTEFGEAAMALNNDYKFEQLLNSYVAFDLTSNSDRRKNYNEMSGRVLKMLTEQNTMDKDVKKHTMSPGIDYTNPSNVPLMENMWTVPMDIVSSQTIRAMDIIYGVGNEPDAVRNEQRPGSPVWVPAMANPQMFYNMANKY
jgi:hypothetical protein